MRLGEGPGPVIQNYLFGFRLIQQLCSYSINIAIVFLLLIVISIAVASVIAEVIMVTAIPVNIITLFLLLKNAVCTRISVIC